MKGQFVFQSPADHTEANIYADKSALILSWLLTLEQERRDGFSVREVSKEVGVSVGLVQRVFSLLVSNGLMQTKGLRTAKKFFFKKGGLLLKDWLDHYSITKKCKMRTYRSGFQEKAEFFDALQKANLSSNVVLALHSAAEVYGCKNTNLDTLELYVLSPMDRKRVEETLQLEPQERGYEVLLIDPYYNGLLGTESISEKGVKASPALLTFLDLYHYPLRGQEQAEFMAERIPELSRIYKRFA
ncbi:MAG: hypothetical protein Q8K75_06910 [Chlamydiales bacterium]|nr:hypothetical protein [Chlamydiales bacterium]